MNMVLFWLIVMVVLIIFEAATVGLVSIWFAGGAVAALVLAFPGMPVWIQTGAFAAVSLVLLLITRPLALKYMKKGQGATSLDPLIGQEVLVTEQIDNLRGTGEVQVDGQYWMARSVDNDQIIEKGEVAMVRSIQGVKLIVGKRIA